MATCKHDCIHYSACKLMGDAMESSVCVGKNADKRCQSFDNKSEYICRVHAQWVVDGDWGECSHCHEASKLSMMEHKDFCPACGAKMKVIGGGSTNGKNEPV